MKLKTGVTFSFADISQDPNGYMLRQHARVGSGARQRGKVRRFKREEELWAAIGQLADDRLAQLGREKIKP